MLFPRDRDAGIVYTMSRIGDGSAFFISFKAINGLVAILVYILLILKYRDPYIIEFGSSEDPGVEPTVLKFPQTIKENVSKHTTLLDTCCECFYSEMNENLFDCMRKNAANVIDALMSMQSGDYCSYMLHETYKIHARKICYENNTDEYCYYKLCDIDRDIIIGEPNEFCKDILYTCRHIADAFSIVANALNWNANREGGEVEVDPKKWFDWIID